MFPAKVTLSRKRRVLSHIAAVNASRKFEITDVRHHADVCKISARSADCFSPMPRTKVPDTQGGVGAHLLGCRCAPQWAQVRTYGVCKCAPTGCVGAHPRTGRCAPTDGQVRTYGVHGSGTLSTCIVVLIERDRPKPPPPPTLMDTSTDTLGPREYTLWGKSVEGCA